MRTLTRAERQRMIEELVSFWHENAFEFTLMPDAELANEYAGMTEVQERRQSRGLAHAARPGTGHAEAQLRAEEITPNGLHCRRPSVTCDRITEKSIELLIRAFYDKVRRDPLLRPIFTAAIGNRWDAHMAKICTFWARAMRISKEYRGDMLAAHQRLGPLSPELFERWLRLFNETVAEHFADIPAAALRDRAQKTAKNLQLALSHPMGKAPGAATQTRNGGPLGAKSSEDVMSRQQNV